MTPIISVFERSPDEGQGQARDTRVRWALEEVGQSYEVLPVSFKSMKQPAYRALHPFGQIPMWRENGLVLFESGAIVFHIAERHGGLLPTGAGRARAVTWMFAALSTMEPSIVDLEMVPFVDKGRPWHDERLATLQTRVRERLSELAEYLRDRDWLEPDGFTAGDLLMIMVLRRLEGAIIDEFPTLVAYVARGESRPAFQRAYAAQRAFFLEATSGNQN